MFYMLQNLAPNAFINIHRTHNSKTYHFLIIPYNKPGDSSNRCHREAIHL